MRNNRDWHSPSTFSVFVNRELHFLLSMHRDHALHNVQIYSCHVENICFIKVIFFVWFDRHQARFSPVFLLDCSCSNLNQFYEIIVVDFDCFCQRARTVFSGYVITWNWYSITSIRVTAGSGFGQMFNLKTVLGSSRTWLMCSIRRTILECTWCPKF